MVEPASVTMRPRREFSGLESLRGVAALGVALAHVGWATVVTSSGIVRNSYLMVDLFFVLSGFVMIHSYGHRVGDARAWARFMLLRVGRLYPLHLAMLGVFVAIEGAKWIAEARFGLEPTHPAFSASNGSAFLTNLLLIHGFGFAEGPSFNYPSWSISVELYTYALFGLALLAFGRRASRMPVWVAPWIALAAYVVLILGGFGFKAEGLSAPLRCLGGFFLGVSLYPLFQALDRRPDIGRAAGPVVVLALGVVVALMSVKTPHSLDWALPGLFAVIVLSVSLLRAGNPVHRLLDRPVLRWLGIHSYSIYMVHAAVAWVCVQVLRVALSVPARVDAGGQLTMEPEPVIAYGFLVLFLATLLLASSLTYRFIEAPGRRASRLWADRRFEATAPKHESRRERRRPGRPWADRAAAAATDSRAEGKRETAASR